MSAFPDSDCLSAALREHNDDLFSILLQMNAGELSTEDLIRKLAKSSEDYFQTMLSIDASDSIREIVRKSSISDIQTKLDSINKMMSKLFETGYVPSSSTASVSVVNESYSAFLKRRASAFVRDQPTFSAPSQEEVVITLPPHPSGSSHKKLLSEVTDLKGSLILTEGNICGRLDDRFEELLEVQRLAIQSSHQRYENVLMRLAQVENNIVQENNMSEKDKSYDRQVSEEKIIKLSDENADLKHRVQTLLNEKKALDEKNRRITDELFEVQKRNSLMNQRLTATQRPESAPMPPIQAQQNPQLQQNPQSAPMAYLNQLFSDMTQEQRRQQVPRTPQQVPHTPQQVPRTPQQVPRYQPIPQTPQEINAEIMNQVFGAFMAQAFDHSRLQSTQ